MSTVCWCPCNCGCNEDDLESDGLCLDCKEGNHETPPQGVSPSLENLIRLHESILAQYREILKSRK